MAWKKIHVVPRICAREGKTLRVSGRAVAVALGIMGCNSPTTSPTPPGGGQSFVLDYATFVSTVEPALGGRGCDNTSCHGGGIRGTFELSPATDKNVGLDFAQASLQVSGSDPVSSLLLLKPLDESAGGVAHAGSPQASFPSTSDADYLAILAWIEAGEYR